MKRTKTWQIAVGTLDVCHHVVIESTYFRFVEMHTPNNMDRGPDRLSPHEARQIALALIAAADRSEG